MLFLSSRDMELIEELWESRVPLEVVLKSIEDGFTAVFRRKRRRMITLWSLRKRIFREKEKYSTRMAGAGEKMEKTQRIGGELGALLEEGYSLLSKGEAERALEVDDKITELIWTEATEEEKHEAIEWARKKVAGLKIPEEAREEIAMKGAKRRLRERKKVPFIF